MFGCVDGDVFRRSSPGNTPKSCAQNRCRPVRPSSLLRCGVGANRLEKRSVDGQTFKVTTPGRVLYPSTGTSKDEVIDYYLAVADVLLPHLAGRPATRKRWPDGVDGPEFFVKDLEPSTPDWLTRVQLNHNSGIKFYPVFDTPAGLGWLGQISALELHVPQWRLPSATGPAAVTSTSSDRHPDRVVFDLDPGPSVGLAECARVALYLRERLGELGRPASR